LLSQGPPVDAFVLLLADAVSVTHICN
jgi:hypothetical protein